MTASTSPLTATASFVQPLPSRSIVLSRLLVRIRNKMETTKRRTWFELQRDHYFTNPPAIHNTTELASALQHFHVSLGEDELRLLMASFNDEALGGFSFKRMAARLYPMDGVAGFDGRGEAVHGGGVQSVLDAGVAESARSSAGKVGVIAAVPAGRTAPFASTASAFPVMFASPSSTNTSTSITSIIRRAVPTSTTTKSTAAAKPTAFTASRRSAALPSSTRASAPLHHPSRYVKQATAIGRVYTERVYDSSEHESQRTAYIKYVNDGYWTRV